MTSLNRETNISILPKSRYEDYWETDLIQANERILALRDRIVEIENGELGEVARGFSDGVVFSNDDLLTMPTYCFYDVSDVMLAIELEEEYIRKNTRVVELHAEKHEEDITPGQISIWEWLECQDSNAEETESAA